jgi:uncharacterized lipoprotein YbaY
MPDPAAAAQSPRISKRFSLPVSEPQLRFEKKITSETIRRRSARPRSACVTVHVADAPFSRHAHPRRAADHQAALDHGNTA